MVDRFSAFSRRRFKRRADVTNAGKHQRIGYPRLPRNSKDNIAVDWSMDESTPDNVY